MRKNITRKKSKPPTVDFTKDFKCFDSKVTNYLLKNKTRRIIQVIDFIFPLIKTNKNFYKIKDHINLSGCTPLNGAIFVSLSTIYSSKNGIVVCGLKNGTRPSNKEKKILLKAGIYAYCYNLIETAIYAASLGLEIKAFGIVQK